MPERERSIQPKCLEPKLTVLEEGLKNAILADDRTRRAFRNLVARGYGVERLIVHLTLWARSPEVLFKSSARSDLPTRDARRTLERFPLKLRAIADELVGQSLYKELLNSKFLARNQTVQESGGLEMVRHMQLLPQTLLTYSRLLTQSLVIKNRFARHEKTLNQHRAEFTRIFFDLVKGTTGKDRTDSVAILFNTASAHFSLGEHFEKRALTAQLRRLREKAQRPRHHSLAGKAGLQGP